MRDKRSETVQPDSAAVFIAHVEEIAGLLNQGMPRQDIHARFGKQIGIGMTQFNDYIRRFISVRYAVRKGAVRRALKAATSVPETPLTTPPPTPVPPASRKPHGHSGGGIYGRPRKSYVVSDPDEAKKFI